MSSTAIRKNKAEGAAQPEPETSRPRPERHCSVRKTVEIVLDSWTFLVVLISIFFAITCLNLYIMSIYLSNIYNEIKQRPLYIIESVKRF